MAKETIDFNSFLFIVAEVIKLAEPDKSKWGNKLNRVRDSKDKENGLFNQYNLAIGNRDGTITPFKGTKVLLKHFGVPLKTWQASLR